MAESDAAGPLPNGKLRPSPNRSRPTSVADVIREIERQRAPLVAEVERAERSRRRLMAEFGLNEEAEPPTPPPEPAKAVAPPAMRPKPETAGRPVFEVDPGETLLAAMRQAFPGFKPTDRWWSHVEMELKTAHHRSNPEAHDAFVTAFWNWSADDLIRHLESEGRIPALPKGGRRHKRTVEGLKVDQWVAAMAAANPSFRYFSQREAAKLGPFSARCIGTCELWIQMKTMVRNEAREAAERAKDELANRYGEDEAVGGFRQSSTKHGIGIQRPTTEELENRRDAKDFLRSRARQSGKKRPD
jgi:hypothetical protein